MIIEEWHSDLLITEDLAKSCILEQFDYLAPIKEVKTIGEGWDNKAFLLNEQIVFRFPRHQAAVAQLQRENKLLNHLAKLLNIQIPQPKYLGHPTTAYPYPFHGYEIITGVPAYLANLSQLDYFSSLEPLAIFLKQLHNIAQAEAITFGAELQEFSDATVNQTIKTFSERINKIIKRKIVNLNQACFKEEIAAVKRLKPAYNDKCLIHGDLDCRHLMFNQHRLVGIIDWGDVEINNRAADLAIVWSLYPPECHERFLSLYGSVDEATWQFARFLGLYDAIALILYGAGVADKDLLAAAIDAVKRINKDLLNP